MDINNIDDLLKNKKADVNKVVALIFEITIVNQAYLKEVLFQQANLLEIISTGEMPFKETFTKSQEAMDKHVAELRADLISKIL